MRHMVWLLAILSLARASDLRVITHSSFALDEKLVQQFEQQNGVTVQWIKAGDAGEMLSKLILTQKAPIADVVYGLDNTLVARAVQNNILEPYRSPQSLSGKWNLGAYLTPINYGYVTLNYHKATVQKRNLALPKTLSDFATAPYKNTLVVQNPATSSTGLAFLLSTIAYFGEQGAYEFWAKLRDNGLKVTRGWTEAYYTDFAQNGGTRPFVVSYSTSPAAEMFYAQKKPKTAPTANIFLQGAVFLQVEGAGVIKGGKNPEAAKKFINFLLSKDVQSNIPTQMWVYPVVSGVVLDPVFKYASAPPSSLQLNSETITAQQQKWLNNWTKIVLRGADPKKL